MHTTNEVVVIPLRVRAAVMQLEAVTALKASASADLFSVADGRRLWEVRVTVRLGDGACPMRVVVPVPAPGCPGVGVGSVVEFTGLRVELLTVGSRCRPIVRADEVQEVGADVRAA